MAMKPRPKAFLEALPKHKNNVLRTAIAVGYSEKYARANGRAILNNAIKESAKQVIEKIDNKELTTQEVKQSMYEILGYSKEDVLSKLRYIADQEKDLASKLKVLAPLAKELGVILQDEDSNKVVVPVLNIGVRNVPIEGYTEPQNE